MKLAEGLVLRADLKKRIEQHRARLGLSAQVQEGEAPPEKPEELLEELTRMLDEMTSLIKRINRTNLQALLPDGKTLTDALAERDSLDMHYSVLSAAVDAAIPRVDRLGRAEIRKLPTINIAEMRRRMDDIARERRELDMVIQSVNWTTELME